MILYNSDFNQYTILYNLVKPNGIPLCYDFLTHSIRTYLSS